MERPDNFTDEMYGEIDQVFTFNHDEFPYGVLGCWYQILYENPDFRGIEADFVPEEGFDHIITPISRGFSDMKQIQCWMKVQYRIW